MSGDSPLGVLPFAASLALSFLPCPVCYFLHPFHVPLSTTLFSFSTSCCWGVGVELARRTRVEQKN